jgi:hypothetical protein
MMVLYEVNLRLKVQVENNYIEWLNFHIKEILMINGFIDAQIYFISRDLEFAYYSVHYFIKSEELLNIYFEKYAPKLRKDALDKFGDNFSASRRVLKLIKKF